jgi:reductive dehalogenase
VNFKTLDKLLLPYEKKLRAQELLRKLLGVKEIERPTYEKYITGPIERFDSRKNAFALLSPDNPYGDEFRKKFKRRTGVDHEKVYPPYNELEVEDRIAMSLVRSARRLCEEYHPDTLTVTPPGGRIDVTDKAWMTRLIKKVALFLGAEMVRVTEIDERWVYENEDIPHRYAIIIVVSHHRSFNDTSPSFLSDVAVRTAYSRLKFITTQLADFICGLGYDAMYQETLGGRSPKLLMVPMAIDAGIGEFSRNGRCLSPEFGINMRLKAVTTDLPLAADKPISFNVHEFCTICKNCAIYCPANAISSGPPTEAPDSIFHNPGYKKWYFRADRCLTFFAANRKKWLNCGGRCISVCPWNKPINVFHNTIRWGAIHFPGMLKKLLVQADRLVYQRKKKIKN